MLPTVTKRRTATLIVGLVLLFGGAVLAATLDTWFGLLAVAGALIVLPLRTRWASDSIDGASLDGSGHDGLGGRGAVGRGPRDGGPPVAGL